MQASSLSFLFLAHSSYLLTNLTIMPVGEPGTKTMLYDCMAFSVMNTISGISRTLGPRAIMGARPAHFCGLEAHLNGEVIRVAAQLNRQKAEKIVQSAYSCCLDQLDKKLYVQPF